MSWFHSKEYHSELAKAGAPVPDVSPFDTWAVDRDLVKSFFNFSPLGNRQRND
jgi:hypothetical protein